MCQLMFVWKGKNPERREPLKKSVILLKNKNANMVERGKRNWAAFL